MRFELTTSDLQFLWSLPWYWPNEQKKGTNSLTFLLPSHQVCPLRFPCQTGQRVAGQGQVSLACWSLLSPAHEHLDCCSGLREKHFCFENNHFWITLCWSQTKRTETRLRGIKQKKMEIIPLSLVSILLFVTIRAYFETILLLKSLYHVVC